MLPFIYPRAPTAQPTNFSQTYASLNSQSSLLLHLSSLCLHLYPMNLLSISWYLNCLLSSLTTSHDEAVANNDSREERSLHSYRGKGKNYSLFINYSFFFSSLSVFSSLLSLHLPCASPLPLPYCVHWKIKKDLNEWNKLSCGKGNESTFIWNDTSHFTCHIIFIYNFIQFFPSHLSINFRFLSLYTLHNLTEYLCPARWRHRETVTGQHRALEGGREEVDESDREMQVQCAYHLSSRSHLPSHWSTVTVFAINSTG